MPNRSFILITLAVVLLNACATQQPQQLQWRHNQLSGQAAQQQHAIDSAACVAAARNATAPLPQPPRDTVTNFSAYTSSGGYVRGQARTTTESGMYGAPAGIQQAEMENRGEVAVANMVLGCMAQRGWTWR